MNHRPRVLAAESGRRYDELHEVRALHALHVEVPFRLLSHYRRGEWPELLAVLDAIVDDIAHLRCSGIGQDASVPERARAVPSRVA
jgi:hypothetical protein